MVRAPAEAFFTISRTLLNYQETIMVRRSTSSNHAQLSVTLLEAREIPAGMIEVGMFIGSSESFLGIAGDNKDNHIRVERPNPAQVVVSSDSGPIRYYDSVSGQFIITTDPVVFTDYVSFFPQLNCDIQTGNGDDVVEVTGDGYYDLRITTERGNDQVLVAAGTANSRIDTGLGDDLVTLRDCVGTYGWPSYTSVFTGAGDDRVDLRGTNHFAGLFISLGNGDDGLEGDSNSGSSLTCDSSFAVYGGEGRDRMLNADYFTANQPPLFFIDGIEETN